MSISSSQLIHQATCAVLINGEIKGTAWLVTGNGHLLTAGHVLGKNAPVSKVEVRFEEDIPREAYKIQWDYQPQTGTDFAVLKLTSAPPHVSPLPTSLAKEVTGDFRLCGYGVTLQDRSEGMGIFVGLFDPQDFSGNRLFRLRSPETGEVGYSGAAVFSEELQAVVAIQIEAATAKVGAGHDTVLAMPMYRIVQGWDLLQYLTVGKASKAANASYSDSEARESDRGIFDTTSRRPDHFIGRKEELEELKQSILTTNPQIVEVIVIYGMAGTGKTALVIELAHQLAYQFPGGILWADFPSNRGDPLPILASWAQLLGRPDLINLPSKDIRAQAVKRAIRQHIAGNGRMLAIFDDVRNTQDGPWLEGAHLLLKAVPEGTALLVTTRETGIAASLRAQHTRLLNPLKTEDAIALTKEWVKGITSTLAGELADLTGNLPLAIEIASAIAKINGLENLMDSLRNPETGIETLNIEGTSRKEDSIRLSFSISFETLPTDSAQLFQILGIFAQGYIAKNWVSSLLNILATDVEFQGLASFSNHLRDLTNRNLLQQVKTGYRFHPLLGKYANLLLRTNDIYTLVANAHMKYFLALTKNTDTDGFGQALENILQAADCADRNNAWQEVIDCAQNLAMVGKFLHLSGYWQIAIKLLYSGVRASENLGDLHSQVVFLREIGIHQRESGKYDVAEVTFQEGLDIAHNLKDNWLLADLYFNAGYLKIYQYNSEKAIQLLQKGIDFAETSGNMNALGEALRGIGRVKLSQGEFEVAEAHLQRSRDILKQAKNQQGLAYGLRSLGEIEAVRGDLDKSLSYLEEALQIATKVGDKQAIAYISRGLGDTYKEKGNYQQAIQEYVKSEGLYRDVGDHAALAATLCNVGEIHLLLSQPDKAKSYFEESIDLVKGMQVARWQGRSLFGLARVQEGLGSKEEALKIGEQALKVLEDARHRDAILVQRWLKPLSDGDNG